MSTNDVPGAKTANQDELAMGCWAEHDDGTLLFVASTENDTVVYSMFDLSKTPPQEFRDKMPKKAFEKHFSYNPLDENSIKWIWHDKTPFPWDKVIKAGIKDGVLTAVSAHDQLKEAHNVAQVVGDKLGLIPKTLDVKSIEHMADAEVPKNVRDIIQEGISECPVGEDTKKQKKLAKLQKKREKIDRKMAALVG